MTGFIFLILFSHFFALSQTFSVGQHTTIPTFINVWMLGHLTSILPIFIHLCIIYKQVNQYRLLGIIDSVNELDFFPGDNTV